MGETYSALYSKTKNNHWLDKLEKFIVGIKEVFPNHPAILELDFDLYFFRNNLPAATATLSKLKNQAGIDINRLKISEAMLLFQKNQKQGYKKLLSMSQPRLTYPYFHNKAFMEDKLNYFESLEKTALLWLDDFPDSEIPSFYLAVSYLSQGKLEQAVHLNQKIYMKKPDYHPLFNMALCQLLLGRFDKSIENFEKVLAISSSAEAQLNLAEALKAANDPRANHYLSLALEEFQKMENPNSLDLAYQALTLAHLKKDEKAIITLQQAARSEQRDDSFFLVAAYVYSLLNQPSAALFNAREAQKHGFRAHWFQLPWTAALYQKLTEQKP